MKLLLGKLFPIFLLATTLVLTGCFEKKKEEETLPSTDGGGSTTPPPSNNYGYVTLSYPTVSGTYKNGWSDPFPETLPVTNISGASLTAFTVTPSLPQGLNLDPNTGAISGTAVLGNWTEQSYTVSAQKPDNEGTVQATFSFGFSHNAQPLDSNYHNADLRYPNKKVILIVGQAMTPITPTYSGPAISGIASFSSYHYSSSPTFGQFGLNFDTETGTFSGTPTQPVTDWEIIVDGGNGGTGAFILTIVEGAPSNLTYTNNSPSYPIGHAITTNTPTASGGNVASYSVSPALPAGLSLNTTTGEITGTPSAITATANYTITATNIVGSTTKQLSITITDAAPAALSYVTLSARYTVGASITANTPIVTGGGTPTSYSVNPALPAGLTLNTSNGHITGMPTAMTAAASYTVTASNAVGSANRVIGINVVEPGSHVLYAANGSVLKAYSVDEVTGEPVFIGKQINSGVYSKLEFHPTVDCAFGFSGGAVEAFTINKSAHGELTAAGAVGGLSSPKNMVMSADGKFLFVVNNQDPNVQFIRKFEVNPADCTLSNASNFSVNYSTTYTVRDLALAGNNIYVSYNYDPTLTPASSKIRHLIFDSNGDLTFQQDYTGGGDRYIVAKADGTRIYSVGEQSIKAYTMDGSGNLTQAWNSSDNSNFMSSSVYSYMDKASDKLIVAARNGANAFGLKYVSFAGDGTINGINSIFGNDVLQYYSTWNTVSAHTSQSGTYLYSTFTQLPQYGGTQSSVRLKIESNGAITSKGLGLIGHISGY